MTPSEKAAALRLLREIDAMTDLPTEAEIMADYHTWAAGHPAEAEALHARLADTIRDCIERRRELLHDPGCIRRHQGGDCFP